MSKFRAFRINEKEGRVISGFEQIEINDLSEGDVTVKVSHSSINYKDALAATGKGKILKKYPLVGGIDLVGVIQETTAKNFSVGDNVLVNGCGLSEIRDGGYSEYARVSSESVIKYPKNINAYQAMQIGTAGYTAALAIHQMEKSGQSPSMGPIVVTGATGGVGSIAVDMLSSSGYEVVAITGKNDQINYLNSIGAQKVIIRGDLDFGKDL